MADRTGIEWTDASWNPVVGCGLVSPGCTNCYAMGQAARIVRCSEGLGRPSTYDGTVETVKGRPVWTGKVALASEATLTQPLRWKRPRRIFVNSMGDLFHEDVPDEWIDRVFAVMALAPQHKFQILTKRSARMRGYFEKVRHEGGICDSMSIIWQRAVEIATERNLIANYQPQLRVLPNVWLGVSAEDQRRAEERIPDLLATPAAIRFVSAEPLLGAINFEPWLSWGDGDAEIDGKTWGCPGCDDGCGGDCPEGKAHYHITEGEHDEDGIPEWINAERVTLDWIIVGGESGPSARPMHPDWARSIRDQCAAASTAFFFKQWGEWAPGESCSGRQTRTEDAAKFYGEEWTSPGWHYERISVRVSEELHCDDEPDVWRVGKARARRLLDGMTHDAMPEALD